MSALKLSVVIPVWNEWHHTKNCLDTLRPTLGLRDEVIVVDNGSEDFTKAGLGQYPWITVISNEENLGFAKACNQGAAAATGDVVIFLNNDTLLANRWTDALVKPFEDPSVGATGPRSNFVSGPQLVEAVPYSTQKMSDYRAFVKTWQAEHADQTQETSRLVGFCLAVRREDFEAIGGFDEGFGTGGCEDDDLCLRLIDAGKRLLITHGSFVHHVGHATFDANGVDWFAIQTENMELLRSKHANAPVLQAAGISTGISVNTNQVWSSPTFLSACMIIKDELTNLSDCLTSLNGLVDEVVIYDTGSTDGSIELARAAGATVIEGYWDDDFGRARNEALAACNGTWVLHIDADERFVGNARHVRDDLQNSQVTAWLVEIENLSEGNKSNLTHRPCRIFRRDTWHWTGRLHEQTVRRDGTQGGEVSVLEGAKLVHYGYLDAAVQAKNKTERNIRIAQLQADSDDDQDAANSLTNLGRSLVLAGRHEEALALFIRARAVQGAPSGIRRTLLRSGAQACLSLGRPEDALEWVEEYSAESELQDSSRYFRGIAYSDAGKWEQAIAELAGLHSMRDDDGVVFPMWVAQVKLGAAYASLGRWEEAADAVTPAAITAEMHDEPIWALVVEAYWNAGRSLKKLLSDVPAQHINQILGQMGATQPAAADATLEALFEMEDKRSSVLALAIRVAPYLPIERALEWSGRLRAVNLDEHCPLMAIAWEPMRDSVQRAQAAAIIHTAFSDNRATTALRVIASGAKTTEFRSCLVQISEFAPELLEQFITTAANNAERGLAMGQVLHELGASDEGVAVVLHALENGAEKSVAESAGDWLESVGRTEEAAVARESSR